MVCGQVCYLNHECGESECHYERYYHFQTPHNQYSQNNVTVRAASFITVLATSATRNSRGYIKGFIQKIQSWRLSSITTSVINQWFIIRLISSIVTAEVPSSSSPSSQNYCFYQSFPLGGDHFPSKKFKNVCFFPQQVLDHNNAGRSTQVWRPHTNERMFMEKTYRRMPVIIVHSLAKLLLAEIFCLF